MAAVEVTISGVLYDKHSRVGTPVTLIGEAIITGLGVGGGPMPPGQGGGGDPPGIWGGPIDPYPDHGLPGKPPGIWGPTDPRPTPPIVLPPEQVPPGMKPPTAPAPGSPTTKVEGNFPVNPMVPPEYLVLNYPGIGPVVVAPPAGTSTTPPPSGGEHPAHPIAPGGQPTPTAGRR